MAENFLWLIADEHVRTAFYVEMVAVAAWHSGEHAVRHAAHGAHYAWTKIQAKRAAKKARKAAKVAATETQD